MISPKIQSEDKRRVQALSEYRIANTAKEKCYSDIAKLAKQICNTDIALVTFIDEDMQWFKAHEGTEIDRNTRELAVCSHCIEANNGVLYVPDTQKSILLKNNPMTQEPYNVNFYSGISILSHEGYAIGTLCVMNKKSMHLDHSQQEALVMLRNQVMLLLEMRRAQYKLEAKELQLKNQNIRLKRFASAFSHDIRNPLGNIFNLQEVLKTDYATDLSEEGIELLDMIGVCAEAISDMSEGILKFYSSDYKEHKAELFDLDKELKTLSEVLALKRPVSIKTEHISEVNANKPGLLRVFTNLITNSIKYNTNDVCEISIALRQKANLLEFTFTDNGIGISESDYDRIFEEFVTIDSSEVSERKSSGLGLAAVQRIITDLGGEISIKSQLGVGTEFRFTIKKSE